MASCHRKGNKWYVVVSVKDDKTGNYDTDWLPFEDEAEARRICAEISEEEKLKKANKRAYKSVTKASRTVQQLIWEYIETYGVKNWSPSTYTNNVARAINYIIPHIGDTRVIDCNKLYMDKFFTKLETLDAVQQRGKAVKPISAKTCEEVHKFLKAMFNQAMEWEMADINPCYKKTAQYSEYDAQRPPFWTMPQFLESAAKIEAEELFDLLAALFLSVSTTLREGEVCGLQWPRCHISLDEIASGDCRVEVDRELLRVKKDVMRKLNNKGILHVFPDMFGTSKSSLVLKVPKSKASIRTVWMPPTVARMLRRHKARQDAQKALLGSDYRDNDLVFAHPDGRPIEGSTLNDWLQAAIVKCGLPPVTYHSSRHTSTTYKLKLSKGDIKNVQGDTGHGSAQMVTEVYAEIIDSDRKYNAQAFEAAYFSGLPVNSDTFIDLQAQIPATVAAQAAAQAPAQALSSDEIINFMAVIEKNPEFVRQLLAANGVTA